METNDCILGFYKKLNFLAIIVFEHPIFSHQIRIFHSKTIIQESYHQLKFILMHEFL
jgi:hypothetical protein